jgi:tetratricopeptide (TPR) repeat protein
MFIAACSSQEAADFRNAEKANDQGHYSDAMANFDKVVKRNSGSKVTVDAAREGARVAFFEVKDYEKAIYFHQFLVLNSADERERVESQKQIATIYFNNLQNYQKAIIEFSKLQQMHLNDYEQALNKINLARAQYYLNNFFQAESEIDSLLKLRSDDNIRFNATMLKGNILVARKDFVKAAELFKGLMHDFPSKSVAENVALTLAVCYEENNDFKSAIATLETLRGVYKPPEYIELRIKRLQERLRNAPGAKGFRK